MARMSNARQLLRIFTEGPNDRAVQSTCSTGLGGETQTAEAD